MNIDDMNEAYSNILHDASCSEEIIYCDLCNDVVSSYDAAYTDEYTFCGDICAGIWKDREAKNVEQFKSDQLHTRK